MTVLPVYDLLADLLGPEEVQAAARALAERTAAAQGLPACVTDSGVIDRVARLVNADADPT